MKTYIITMADGTMYEETGTSEENAFSWLQYEFWSSDLPVPAREDVACIKLIGGLLNVI